MRLVAGELVAERYRLVRPLEKGGMGSVWLAQDVSLDTPCAVKFIHAEAAESVEFRARFEREAKSAAHLRSPNVVTILAHGVSDGTPYIAMEYLEGEDLEHRIRRLGRLSPEQILAIMSQVAKVLTRAHAAALVHRDLKPANIFLVPDEGGDLAKVLDFGVAKSTVLGVGGNTKTGEMIGTPYYMSPEQARATKDVDHRSDLWALAVIIFRCVTGRLPFASEALCDLLIQIVTDPLPVPSSVAPGLPASFDAWWARASMRDPAQRFQSARELVDAFATAFGLAHSSPGAVGGSVASPGSASWSPSTADTEAAPGPAPVAHPAARPSSPDARPPRAVSSPGFVAPAATVALSSAPASALTSSVAGGAPPRSRRAGVLLVTGGGVVLLCGALVAVLGFRGSSPGGAIGGTDAGVPASPTAPLPPPTVVDEPPPPTNPSGTPSGSASSAPPPASALAPSPSGATSAAPPSPTTRPTTGKPKPKPKPDPANQM